MWSKRPISNGCPSLSRFNYDLQFVSKIFKNKKKLLKKTFREFFLRISKFLILFRFTMGHHTGFCAINLAKHRIRGIFPQFLLLSFLGLSILLGDKWSALLLGAVGRKDSVRLEGGYLNRIFKNFIGRIRITALWHCLCIRRDAVYRFADIFPYGLFFFFFVARWFPFFPS